MKHTQNEGQTSRASSVTSTMAPHHGARDRAAADTQPTPAVLLVDSARDSRAMYAMTLRAAGFRTIEADNTADALALAPTADAVVTGIRIQGPFDGVELVRRIRANERTARTALIVLTACAFGEDERGARAAGCDVFLTKPCLPDRLVAELCRLLPRAADGVADCDRS